MYTSQNEFCLKVFVKIKQDEKSKYVPRDQIDQYSVRWNENKYF